MIVLMIVIMIEFIDNCCLVCDVILHSSLSRNLQEKAVNGEHSVWGEGGNLNLSVWQDGKCHHLQIHQKKVCYCEPA